MGRAYVTHGALPYGLPSGFTVWFTVWFTAWSCRLSVPYVAACRRIELEIEA